MHSMQHRCSFDKIDVLGEKWLNFVLRVNLKVVNKASSNYNFFLSVSKKISLGVSEKS